jgi:hypothetical protein
MGRWNLLLTHPVSLVERRHLDARESRDCGFDNLSIDGRKTMNNLFKALILGEDNGFGDDDSPARFQRQLAIVIRTGKLERSPVLFPIVSGLSPLDGNHRLFALQTALNTSEEEFAKRNVKRPSATQKVWIATHKNGEDPG